jgi:transposase
VVRESMRTDPFCGVVYVFRAKRADRVKLIFWDGSGVVLVAKRLENGHFHWPAVRDGVMRLSAAQSQSMLEGLDWRRVHEARLTAVPTAASLAHGLGSTPIQKHRALPAAMMHWAS